MSALELAIPGEEGVSPASGDAERPADLRGAVQSMLVEHARSTRPCVILIAGPGCAGKSTFSGEMVDVLMGVGMTAALLEIDCYLIERAKRQNGAVSFGGYHPSAYLLDQAAADIAALMAGRSVEVSPYDKRTSGRGLPITVTPQEVLLIEGSMALQPQIRSFGTLRLFCDVPQDVLYRNRCRRELQLGLTPEAIDAKFALLSEDYPRFIRPQRDYADVLIEIDDRYRFTSAIRRGASSLNSGVAATG